jgi:hypothetical protein
MSIGDVAADFGKGLFAGAAGTAAMTVSSTLEMKLSGRGSKATATDLLHHVVYSTARGLAYSYLDRNQARSR